MPSNSTKVKAEPNQETWDEQRLQESMDHLKLLHIRLRELRTTIPRMLEPLTTKQSSPEALFHSFSQSVMASHKEVADFTELRKDPKSAEILAHAAARRKEEPAGIEPWTGKEDPNWTTLPKTSSS